MECVQQLSIHEWTPQRWSFMHHKGGEFSRQQQPDVYLVAAECRCGRVIGELHTYEIRDGRPVDRKRITEKKFPLAIEIERQRRLMTIAFRKLEVLEWAAGVVHEEVDIDPEKDPF